MYPVFSVSVKAHYIGEFFIAASNANEAQGYLTKFKKDDKYNDANSYGLEDTVSMSDIVPNIFSPNKGIVYNTLYYVG